MLHLNAKKLTKAINQSINPGPLVVVQQRLFIFMTKNIGITKFSMTNS